MAKKGAAGTNQPPDFIPAETPDFIPAEPAATAAPQNEVRAAPTGVGPWLTSLESDLRYGGTQTLPGRVLHKMGYQAPEPLGNEGGNAGKMMVSPLTGPVFAAHGVTQLPSHPLRGTGEILSGIGEASQLPMGFASPETSEMAASGAAKIAESPITNALKEGSIAAAKELPKAAIRRIPYVGKVAADVAGKATKAYQAAKVAAPDVSEGLPEVEAAQPAAAKQLRSTIANQKVLQAQPQTIAEGLPEVEAGRPEAEQRLRNVIATPHEAQPLPPIKPAKVEAQLNESLGGKPLQRNVPLRQQLPNAPKPTEPVPAEAPVPKESSVIKAHSYDPASRTLEVHTHSGSGYRYADVNPEDAAEIANAESKGKAWNAFRNKPGVTLTEKLVNGKWQSVKPTAARMATPNDLTPILKESVKQAKAKK